MSRIQHSPKHTTVLSYQFSNLVRFVHFMTNLICRWRPKTSVVEPGVLLYLRRYRLHLNIKFRW